LLLKKTLNAIIFNVNIFAKLVVGCKKLKIWNTINLILYKYKWLLFWYGGTNVEVDAKSELLDIYISIKCMSTYAIKQQIPKLKLQIINLS